MGTDKRMSYKDKSEIGAKFIDLMGLVELPPNPNSGTRTETLEVFDYGKVNKLFGQKGGLISTIETDGFGDKVVTRYGKLKNGMSYKTVDDGHIVTRTIFEKSGKVNAHIEYVINVKSGVLHKVLIEKYYHKQGGHFRKEIHKDGAVTYENYSVKKKTPSLVSRFTTSSASTEGFAKVFDTKDDSETITDSFGRVKVLMLTDDGRVYHEKNVAYKGETDIYYFGEIEIKKRNGIYKIQDRYYKKEEEAS